MTTSNEWLEVLTRQRGEIAKVLEIEGISEEVKNSIRKTLDLMDLEIAREEKNRYMGVEKIISGGQTGVDQMGLIIARKMGIATGGTAPKGFRTEDGPQPKLAEFGLTEHASAEYGARTEQNVLHSHGTVIFGDISSAGTAQTIRLCVEHEKPYIVNPLEDQLKAWLDALEIRILNVAGNRGSKVTDEQLQIYADVLAGALLPF